MSEVSKLKLFFLRAMYLLITVGLVLTIWPEIIVPNQRLANEETVIQSLLGALALLAALGIRYPLKMLPILIFEFIWKLIWVFSFALPTWLNHGLDTYAKETLFACLIGVVLIPIIMPWHYVYNHYIKLKQHTNPRT